MLLAELGRYPLEIVIKTRMINYWNKLLSGSENKIARICYENMLKSPDSFKWLTFIKGPLS
jgi:hypothetical protein